MPITVTSPAPALRAPYAQRHIRNLSALAIDKQNATHERSKMPIQGRRAVIFWDVENVRPFAPTVTLPIQVYRLKVSPPCGAYFGHAWHFMSTVGPSYVHAASHSVVVLCKPRN